MSYFKSQSCHFLPHIMWLCRGMVQTWGHWNSHSGVDDWPAMPKISHLPILPSSPRPLPWVATGALNDWPFHELSAIQWSAYTFMPLLICSIKKTRHAGSIGMQVYWNWYLGVRGWQCLTCILISRVKIYCNWPQYCSHVEWPCLIMVLYYNNYCWLSF